MKGCKMLKNENLKRKKTKMLFFWAKSGGAEAGGAEAPPNLWNLFYVGKKFYILSRKKT